MATDSTQDYWTMPTSAQETYDEPYLKIGTIDGVEPLDGQFGVDRPKTTPDVLYEPLFGQPEATTKPPALYTYAVLDAAKVMNLAETLADSGLKYRCLFKGDAFEELKDVAPWIVRLEDGNTFTRNLFTRSNAPWHLWDTEPGIYLRSRGSLDDMWGHFRKFTKVQDDVGKWFYFRFWEPGSFAEIIQHESAVGLLHGIQAIYVPTRQITHTVFPTADQSIEKRKFKLDPEGRSALDVHIENRFCRDFAANLRKAAPVHMDVLGLKDNTPVINMTSVMLNYLKPIGFTKRSDIGRLVGCGLFYSSHFLYDPRIAPLSQRYLSEVNVAAGLRAKTFEEALHSAVPLQNVAQTVGLAEMFSHLSYALGTTDPIQQWLPKLYTPAFGFADSEIVQSFVQSCREQQTKHNVSDIKQQNAHYVISVIYTPYFLDDPLHESLQVIFESSSSFELRISTEIERRIGMLKEN